EQAADRDELTLVLLLLGAGPLQVPIATLAVTTAPAAVGAPIAGVVVAAALWVLVVAVALDVAVALVVAVALAVLVARAVLAALAVLVALVVLGALVVAVVAVALIVSLSVATGLVALAASVAGLLGAPPALLGPGTGLLCSGLTTALTLPAAVVRVGRGLHITEVVIEDGRTVRPFDVVRRPEGAHHRLPPGRARTIGSCARAAASRPTRPVTVGRRAVAAAVRGIGGTAAHGHSGGLQNAVDDVGLFRPGIGLHRQGLCDRVE